MSATAWRGRDLAQCRQLAADNHAAVQALAAEVVSGARAAPARYANSRGDVFTSTVSAIPDHVALRGMHHRGQVMLGVREAGVAPQATDFVAYMRDGGARTGA